MPPIYFLTFPNIKHQLYHTKPIQMISIRIGTGLSRPYLNLGTIKKPAILRSPPLKELLLWPREILVPIRTGDCLDCPLFRNASSLPLPSGREPRHLGMITLGDVVFGRLGGVFPSWPFSPLFGGEGPHPPSSLIPLQLETRFWGQNYLDLVWGGVRGL